jgi:hypothetical protein
MKQELRDKLNAIDSADGGDNSDDCIYEMLTEAETVKEYGHDEHRWYTMFSTVVKVGDIFVDFEDYSNSGDEPAFDGAEATRMVLDSACEVFEKEVTVVDYVTADKLEA